MMSTSLPWKSSISVSESRTLPTVAFNWAAVSSLAAMRRRRAESKRRLASPGPHRSGPHK
jgi:hypothetical protein